MKHARTAGADILARLLQGVADVVVDGMSTTQRVVGAAIAGVFALTPFGAWDPVVTEPEPLVAGEAIEVGPFDLTVVRAATAGDLGVIKPEGHGNRLFAVVVDVTNGGDVPEYGVTLADAIPPPADAGIVPWPGSQGTQPTIFGIADATPLDIINPGLTYRAALIWEQDGSWAQDEVTVDIQELTWIEVDTTTGLDNERWFAYGDVAWRGKVAITERSDS